jgi:hypothetical protein
MEGVDPSAELRTAIAPQGYVHHVLRGREFDSWLAKHVRYGRSAQQQLRGVLPGSAPHPRARWRGVLSERLVKPHIRFLYHYLLRQGFRDGRDGFDYALMYSWYELTVYLQARMDRPRAE